MNYFDKIIRWGIISVFFFIPFTGMAQTTPQFTILNLTSSDAATTVGHIIQAGCDAKISGTQSTFIKLVMGWAKDGMTIPESKQLVWIGDVGQNAVGLTSTWTPTENGTYTCWIFMAVALIDSQAIAAFPANPSANANTKLVATIKVTAPVSIIKNSTSSSPSPLVRNITAECDVKVSGPKGALIRLVMGWTLEGETIPQSLQVVWTGLDGGIAQKLASSWTPTEGGEYTCWIYPAWAATDLQAITQFPRYPLEDSKTDEIGKIYVYLTSLYWQKLDLKETPASGSPTLSYDSVHDQAVLLIPGESQMETWLFHDYEWEQLHPPISPGYRTYGALRYMPKTGVHLLFGGMAKNQTALSDTWVFDVKQNQWSQRFFAVSPPRSVTPTLVYDDVREVMILVTQPETDKDTAATWEFDGTIWKKTDAGGPGLLTDPMAAYDPLRQRTVLFSSPAASGISSGVSSEDKKTVYDTWEYNGTQWERIQSTHGPNFQYGAGAVYVPDLDGVMFFGNRLNSNPLEMNGWVWKDRSWKRVDFLSPPTPRSSFAMFYQSNLHRVVLFGGSKKTTEAPAAWILKRYDPLVVRNVKNTLSPAILGKLLTAQCDAYVSGPTDTILKLVMGWSRDGALLPDSLQVVWTGVDGTLAESLAAQWRPNAAGEYSCWIHAVSTDSDSQAINHFPSRPQEEIVTRQLCTIYVPESVLMIQRSFQPAEYRPSKTVQVILQIQPKSGNQPEAVVIEETLPPGFVPSHISDSGKYLASKQTIRWFFVDDFRSRLSYTVTIPSEASGEYRFSGEGQCTIEGNIRSSMILGESVLLPADCLLSLDTDQDSLISADELLVGAYQWKQGQTSPTTEDLLIAAGLWKQGGAYRCDGNGNFILDLSRAKSFQRKSDSSSFIANEFPVQAVRELPDKFTSGTSAPVTITITVQNTVDALAVEETVPLGWKVTNISHNGTYEAGSHTIRWFLLTDMDGTLTYTIEPTAFMANDFFGTITWVIGTEVQSAPLSTITGIGKWSYY